MTHVSEDRQTEQRIKVYILTMQLLEEAYELPTWFDIEQCEYNDVSTLVETCRLALEAVRDAVNHLGANSDLDEFSLAANLFATEACLDCQRVINFVCTELLSYAN